MKQSTVRRERKEIFIFSARARFKLDALTRRGCDTYLFSLPSTLNIIFIQYDEKKSAV